MLNGKFIAINANIKKHEISQNSNLTCHIKTLEKWKQIKSKVKRTKEINIRV